MQKQEVHDRPITEGPGIPRWAPPQPPSRRERFVLLFERFGYLFACILTLGVLAVLFVRSEVLLREPDTAPRQAVAPAKASAPLSITTRPVSAAIFIDGAFVGLSPLQAHAVAAGEHRISVQKQDFVTRDTVLTLAGGPALLHLALRPSENTPVVEDNRDQSPLAYAADTTRQDTPLAFDQRVPPEPAPSEEQPANTPVEVEDGPEQAASLPSDTEAALAAVDSDLTNPEPSDLPADDREPLVPEDTLVAAGELHVFSEPSGASVWVGDERVGVTPLVLYDVAAGAQEVTLRLDGYDPYTTTVDVAARQRAEVNGPLTQRLGTLKVLAKPWGSIYIDGTLHKREANIWYTATLPPGNYRVRVEHPSLGKWEQVVVVSPGVESKVEIDFNKGTGPSQ